MRARQLIVPKALRPSLPPAAAAGFPGAARLGWYVITTDERGSACARTAGGDNLDQRQPPSVLLVNAVDCDGVVAAVADVDEAAVGPEPELAAVRGGLCGYGVGAEAGGVSRQMGKASDRSRSLGEGGNREEEMIARAPSRCPRGR